MAWPKLRNTAVATKPPLLPPPQTTINHNHKSPVVSMIFAFFTVGVISVYLFWYALLYLAEQAGARNPEFEVARCLFGLVFLILFLALVGLAARFFLNDYYTHRETMEDMRLRANERLNTTLQAIPATTAPVLTSEDKRRYRAVVVTMSHAYQMIDDDGKLRSKAEPWSRRQVGSYTLLGEAKAIGEDTDLAKWVKPFLLERGVLLDDRTVNLDRFPDLNHVHALLVAEFGRQVMMTTPGQGIGMSSQYIDPGSGDVSWT